MNKTTRNPLFSPNHHWYWLEMLWYLPIHHKHCPMNTTSNVSLALEDKWSVQSTSGVKWSTFLPLVYGSREITRQTPQTVVITDRLARNYWSERLNGLYGHHRDGEKSKRLHLPMEEHGGFDKHDSTGKIGKWWWRRRTFSPWARHTSCHLPRLFSETKSRRFQKLPPCGWGSFFRFSPWYLLSAAVVATVPCHGIRDNRSIFFLQVSSFK